MRHLDGGDLPSRCLGPIPHDKKNSRKSILKNILERIIQKLLCSAGYEIRRKTLASSVARNSMKGALHWIKNNNFTVKTVLDVGASDGRWSKGIMDLFPNAKFVLFEPQPIHSKYLDALSKNHIDKVISVKKAVGGENKKLLFDVSDPFGGGPVTPVSKDIVEVEQTTLDSSLLELQLDGPFLLKLDTHGIEKNILLGAERVLKNCEVLIIEAYNYKITNEAMLFWELCAFLLERGFRPIDLVDLMHRKFDNSLWQMDIFFIRCTWEGFNYNVYD